MKGNEFKKWRVKLGFKIRDEVATYIGVSYETVTKWERDERPVPQYAINALKRREVELQT